MRYEACYRDHASLTCDRSAALRECADAVPLLRPERASNLMHAEYRRKFVVLLIFQINGRGIDRSLISLRHEGDRLPALYHQHVEIIADDHAAARDRVVNIIPHQRLLLP